MEITTFDEDRAAEAVAAVWAKYRPTILGQVEDLEEATASMLSGSEDVGTRRRAERDAHKLAGSVGTFGFLEAARTAAELERLLQSVVTLSDVELLRLSELVVKLRDDLNEGERESLDLSTSTNGAGKLGDPAILIASSDSELSERITLEAKGRGLRVIVATTQVELRATLQHEISACVVDLEMAVDVLDILHRSTHAIPSIVVADEDRFGDRVAVSRRGARAFLAMPVSAREVLDEIERVVRTSTADELRVLIVGVDPPSSKPLTDLLTGYGMVAEALDVPDRFWEVLHATGPDVVIVDLDSTGSAGIDICRVIRNDPRWSSMPVMALTSRHDAETVAEIFTAGADDFVTKPVVGPELLARLTNRLERLRLWRELADSDPLTGLANRRKATEQITQLFETSRSTGDVVSLAMLDVDHLRVANDAGGFAFGDRILVRLSELIRRAFPFDVTTRWAGEEFVVGMYATPSTDGVMRIADLLDAFREEELRHEDDLYVLTFSAGIAEFPADGTTVDDLVRAARAALRSAKQGGGARVLALPREEQLRRLDVLIVESDDGLAKLLMNALETRGYVARWIPDGRSAIASLIGEPPSLQPRLVLLDIDLPDMGGLGVLRRIHGEGKLESLDVVMLTGRSAELEMIKALELGASDHIAKPFSVPELVEKVRQAIGSL